MTDAVAENVVSTFDPLLPCQRGHKPQFKRDGGVTGRAVRIRWYREQVSCECGVTITGKRPNQARLAWNKLYGSQP